MIHRMPSVVWKVMKMKLGWAPLFRFDYDRYKNLIRTCPISQIASPTSDPIVEFQFHAPIDGVLGSYDPDTKKISIDALEIFLISAEQLGATDEHSLADLYDEKITQVLAHEGGHWHLDKRLGRLAMMERYFINACVVLAIAIFIGLMATLFGFLLHEVAYLLVQYVPPIVCGLIELMVVILVTWYLLDWIVFIAEVGKVTSLIMTHKYCIHERFAKRFEKCVDSNPEWEKVIIAKME